MDVANPLFWDIGWILVFGLPALALAYWLLAGRGKARSAASPRRATATLSAITFVACSLSMVPSSRPSTSIVLFGDDTTREQAFSSIAASGAEILWAHESGLVAALNLGSDASRAPLYRGGAIIVTGTLAPCAEWLGASKNPPRSALITTIMSSLL